MCLYTRRKITIPSSPRDQGKYKFRCFVLFKLVRPPQTPPEVNFVPRESPEYPTRTNNSEYFNVRRNRESRRDDSPRGCGFLFSRVSLPASSFSRGSSRRDREEESRRKKRNGAKRRGGGKKPGRRRCFAVVSIGGECIEINCAYRVRDQSDRGARPVLLRRRNCRRFRSIDPRIPRDRGKIRQARPPRLKTPAIQDFGRTKAGSFVR